MSILIGGAWPYANGSLHLGHIASLLPGDILARYFRLIGEEVLYVSGSDCHGTPITIRAIREGVLPSQITDRYHKEFEDCFKRLGFSYDLYGRTDEDFHKEVVQDVFKALLEKGFIYKRTMEQTFCENCTEFLPDRFVEGKCPYCGSIARGDQCDSCSNILDPLELSDRKCKICGSSPTVRNTEHFFLALSAFRSELEKYTEGEKGWRENAVALTKRYLKEGLKDRAVTRDLSWGVSVPLEGYEGKKIYVWIEAVLGYLSVSKKWAAQGSVKWEKFWEKGVSAYYVHGKDNIPFHTLILPALLLAIGLKLPDRIVSSEYLTIEGRKLSTSENWAVWVPEILERYNPDSIRYLLTINGPEKRDTDFSWREFIHRHNSELLGDFGNFINRTLVFVEKFFNSKVPEANLCDDICLKIEELYNEVGLKIREAEFKSALERVFIFVRRCNKYFDENKPWIQIKEAPELCGKTIYTCVQLIANLSNLLSPFLPFTCDRIREYLDINSAAWKSVVVPAQREIKKSEVLFERIDKGRIQEESGKLGKR